MCIYFKKEGWGDIEVLIHKMVYLCKDYNLWLEGPLLIRNKERQKHIEIEKERGVGRRGGKIYKSETTKNFSKRDVDSQDHDLCMKVMTYLSYCILANFSPAGFNRFWV